MRRTAILVFWVSISPIAAAADPAPATTAEAQWRDRVADLALTYRSTLTRFGDGWRAAPRLCDAPPPQRALISAAGPGTPHARKVYRLYVKDLAAYVARADADQPIGQTIVKEAHAVREVTSGDGERVPSADGGYAALVGDAPAELDGRWYVGGETVALFAMLKVGGADAAGTDAGWIYATTSADGATVTALGRVDDCMKCHVDARRDRMFGPRASAVAPPARVVRTAPASDRTSATPPAAPPPPATAGGGDR